MTKRGKNTRLIDNAMTWWDSGWTSGANSTPVVLLISSCEFLAWVEETCETYVLDVVRDVTILSAAILTPFTIHIHHISDPWCVNHVETSIL